MTLIRTVEPEAEPVTLAETKAHLRIAHDSEDDLLAGLIRAAREDVERGTGLALMEQGWRLVLDDLPAGGCVMIARHPVREILSVTAYGTEGEASLISAGDYQADLVSRPARLQFFTGISPLRTLNGIEIDFTAGFGEAGTDVPDLLRRAILVLVAHWYEFRTSFAAADQPVAYPPAYERMISSYRLRRL